MYIHERGCVSLDPEEGNGSPGAGVTSGYELPRSWELNPGPPEGQKMLFTAKSPLQNLKGNFYRGENILILP